MIEIFREQKYCSQDKHLETRIVFILNFEKRKSWRLKIGLNQT